MRTMRILSMAALTLVGTVMTSCSNDDSFDNQQPANNVVTVKTTVSLDDGASTRALTIDETNKKVEKYFKVGDQIKVIYSNGTPGVSDVANSLELVAGDISADGKTATFTVTLTNPEDGGSVEYVYPHQAYNFPLDTHQDGTKESLESKFDIARLTGTMTVSGGTVTLPNLALKNEMAILAIKLKNSNGSSDITNTIKQIIIYDYEGQPGSGSYSLKNSYSVGAPISSSNLFGDVIYVAIRPTDERTTPYIKVDAYISGQDNAAYTKTIGKKFVAGHFYNLGLKMTSN